MITSRRGGRGTDRLGGRCRKHDRSVGVVEMDLDYRRGCRRCVGLELVKMSGRARVGVGSDPQWSDRYGRRLILRCLRHGIGIRSSGMHFKELADICHQLTRGYRVTAIITRMQVRPVLLKQHPYRS